MEATMTPLAKAYQAYQDTIPGHFKPNQKFYDTVGINRKRFGQLLRGEAQMFIGEAQRLADLFKVPFTDLI